MINKLRLRTLLLLITLVTSCTNPHDDPSIPTISITPREIVQNEDGRQFTVSISANAEYDIIVPSNTPWLTKVESSTSSAKFNIESSPKLTERTAKIIFKIRNSTVTDTLTVIQRNSLDERKILTDIYNALDGKNWYNSTNWNSNKPLNEWYGVQTDTDGRVVSISLADNNLSGTIPNSIFKLLYMELLELGSNDNKTLSFADVSSITKLISLKTLRITSLNMGLGFPIEIITLPNLESLTIASMTPRIINVPADIWNATKLTELHMSGQLLRFALSPKISNLTNLKSLIIESQIDNEIPIEIGRLTQLEKLHLKFQYDGIKHYGATSEIPIEIGNLTKLKELILTDGNLIGPLPETIGNIPNLEKFICSGNKLSGQISKKITTHPNWSNWDAEKNIFPQQNGYYLQTELYTSSDYSQDGKIIKLQNATRGTGIDIVIMGDGFVDRDMESGGKYEQRMYTAMESFFDIEPSKSYREYFNVYMIKVVSANEVFSTSNSTTALNVQFGEGTSISGDNPKCFKYASLINGIHIPDAVVNVVVNSPKYAGTCWNYTDGSAIAYIPYIDNLDTEFAKVIHHEVIGHAFSKLLDEYIYYNRYINSEETANFNERRTRFNMGWNMTIDKNNIPWKHFIGHIKYPMVGMHEGGFFCSQGVWRAEENHCMNNNVPYFNGPSRELFVKRLKKIVGEQYLWSEFVINDKYNPFATKAARTKQTRPQLTPPIMVDTDWKGNKAN